MAKMRTNLIKTNAITTGSTSVDSEIKDETGTWIVKRLGVVVEAPAELTPYELMVKNLAELHRVVSR